MSIKDELEQIMQCPQQEWDRRLDQFFAFSINQLEIEHHAETHFLLAQALMTSYADFYQLVIHLGISPSEIFVDIGCGYARSILFLALLLPQSHFIGIEKEAFRLQAAKSFAQVHHISNAEFIVADLHYKVIPKAHYYFLYLETGHLLDKILYQIREYAMTANHEIQIVAIESHGDLISRLLLEQNWLKQSKTLKTCSKRYDSNIYIFETKEKSKIEFKLQQMQLLLQQEFMFQKSIYLRGLSLKYIFQLLKYCENKYPYQVLIEDQDLDNEQMHYWLADLKHINMGVLENTIEFQYPPKIVTVYQIVGLVHAPLQFDLAIHIRQLNQRINGLYLRKLIIAPQFMVEYSNGNRGLLENDPSLFKQ